MKILYLLPHITNNGGMERIVIDKINYLVNKGYKVALAYYGSKYDMPFFYIDKDVKLIPILNVNSYRKFLDKIKLVPKLFYSLLDIISEENPDVIVNANVQIVSWILPFIRKDIPKIIELHFSYEGLQIMNEEIYGNNRIKILINNFLRKYLYPVYDKCVLLTRVSS